MRRLAVISCLLLGACRDGGELHYEQARRLHVQLVSKAEHPTSPAFDAVLVELKQVPADSKRFADAQRLRLAIEAVRAPVRRPLAVAHRDDATLPPEVAAQAKACAALAQMVGRDGGATASAMRALDDCRARVDALDEAAAHREEALQ